MHNRKPAVAGVILDMDGVLCDSEPFICEAAVRMFRQRHHVDVKPEDFLPFVGAGENSYLGGVAAKHGVKLDLVADKKLTYDIYLDIIRGRLKPLPGAREFVDGCRGCGLKLAVASSADLVKVKGNLFELGLTADAFDACVNGQEVENRKPAPDIFELAASRLGLACDRCIVVEDAPNGIRAGKTAGARCLGLTTSFSIKDLQRAGADWIARDLSDVPSDVLRLLG